MASNEFSQHGFRAVTMRGVADKARVSTRTLYNRYDDKLSLFKACLEFESMAFPTPDPAPGEPVDAVLERYAAGVVRALSTDASLRLAMLVYREGLKFPELLRAAEAHEDRLLIQPLAVYLRQAGLERAGSTELAKILLGMALVEWQRAGSFRRPPPNEDDIVRHARLAVRTFLHGASPVDGQAQ